MVFERLRVSILVLCILLLPGISQKSVSAEESMPRLLSLSVHINGNEFSKGDRLAIEYCVNNDSPAESTIIKWSGAPYPSSNLTFLDSKGKQLEIVKTAYYELEFPLPKEAFITLQAGQKHCLRFLGVIDIEKLEETTEGKIPRRILRFDNSYVVLDKVQTFKIIGKYEIDSSSQIEWEKLYNFLGVWVGKLTSAAVEVTVA